MLSVNELFKGSIFDRQIIVLCVRWYLRYKLSFRDLVERALAGAHDDHALDRREALIALSIDLVQTGLDRGVIR